MRRAVTVLSLAVVLYGLATLCVYRASPLGRVAVLDAQENLVLAHQISLGIYPAMPHYRAPLWPAFLSLFWSAGFNESGVLLAGQLANLLLHFAATAAIGWITWRVWGKSLGSLLATALYGFYPLHLYFAGDLLDTIFSQSLLVVGLALALEGWARGRTQEESSQHNLKSPLFYTFSGVFLVGLAALARPQLAVISLGFVSFLIVSALFSFKNRSFWSGFMRLFCPIVALLTVWGGFATLERLRTGTWAVMPTQAAYNLYAANELGGSGQYYAQPYEFLDLPEGYNPTRAAAELKYRQTNNAWGSVTESTINTYWTNTFKSSLAAHPLEHAAFYFKKLYYLLNNHEGYNNKTYAFQKAQNPLLLINPLNFLLLSLSALFVLLFYRPLPKTIGRVIGLGALYFFASGLFFASDRFRLPLVIFSIILCGGLPSAALQVWALWKKSLEGGVECKNSFLKSVGLRGSLMGVWALAFGLPFYNVAGRSTVSADRMLMASASLKVGDDATAQKMAEAVLQENPKQRTAIETLAAAIYNRAMAGQIVLTPELLQKQLSSLDAGMLSAQGNYLRGFYTWRVKGDRDNWHELTIREGPYQIAALAALLRTGALYPYEVVLLKCHPLATAPDEIVSALASLHDPLAIKEIHKRWGKQTRPTQGALLKLFSR